VDATVEMLAVDLEPASDADQQELDELTRRLRTELLQYDVQSVRPTTSRESVPTGSKGGAEAISIGSLAVQLITSPELLTALIQGIKGWLSRQHARSVKLTIDGDEISVTGVSSSEQAKLIDAWIARHADPA
jgi:hypothetical protein